METRESPDMYFVGNTSQHNMEEAAHMPTTNASVEAADTSFVDKPSQNNLEEVENIFNASAETNVTLQEMIMISRMINTDEYRPFARQLKISEQKIQDFETSCKVNNLGIEEIVFQILQEWKQNNGQGATKDILKNALVSIGRTDVVDNVFSKEKKIRSREEIKRQNNEIQQEIERSQVEVYKEVQLPQVIWTERILPLEELYVQLELMKTDDDYERCQGESLKLEQLFDQINGKDPVRMLIEGGPGYGKTTLCCKLLNDWGRNRSYIRSKFTMVFLFQLRYFTQNDSLKEMFRREFQEMGVNGDDGLNCIEQFENETLLILDGIDELSDEGRRKLLPLIRKEEYPSMFVVVTSRRGMFLMDKEMGRRKGELVREARQEVIMKHLWNKKILIKGVTTDKIEIFMRKYFDKEYKDFELKISSIIREEMKEVFTCPLLLILLAMLLEEKTFENINSQTTLYQEFFNFVLKRSLIRENKISGEEKVDIFDKSFIDSEIFQSLEKFGRLGVDFWCENKLLFAENEILNYCKDKVIFHLGFLTKIPKVRGRRKENIYQPIHKSFLEFMAAFAMWNLFQRDENEFKREIEKIGQKGLKPTNDSLFYVFLGGFMYDKAYVLFQCLTRYALWFNIESICFTNILLEIKDIHTFFPSFQPILDSFIPSFYSIDDDKGLSKDYFQSEVHSFILKYSSDRQLIHELWWNSDFSFILSQDLYFEKFHLFLTDEIFQIGSNEISIKCKNIICEFSAEFDIEKWPHFVSLLKLIESENVHFCFDSKSNKINSLVLLLLHKELLEGQWQEMNIGRLRFALYESDGPSSLSLLTDVVKKNRIKEGIYLKIDYASRYYLTFEKEGSEEENNFVKNETENLFNAVIQFNTIKEFIMMNLNDNFSPELNFNRVLNTQVKSIHLLHSINVSISNEVKRENYSFEEEVGVVLTDAKMELNFLKNIEKIKYLTCRLNCVNSLVETEWPGLKEIEELRLTIYRTDQFQLLNSVFHLSNLQVLVLNVEDIENISSDSKCSFINLFSSLNLRLCEFRLIKNLEMFSILTEVLMEGLKKKEKDANNSTIDSNEGKKVSLQELVIQFNYVTIDLNELKKSNGIQRIHSMLRNKQLKYFTWIHYTLNINISLDELESLFPLNDKFRISVEVDGRNQNNSRQSQFDYRWFNLIDRFCIEFIDE